jgi:putative hemolysin
MPVFELIFIFLLMLLNGFLSLSEMAVVSSKRLKLLDLASKNVRGARSTLTLLDSQSSFLASVQVGITLISVVAGMFSGASLSKSFSAWLSIQFPMIAQHAESIGFGLIVALITFLSLVIGELVPKRIALSDPERISTRVAPLLLHMSRVLKPLVYLLNISTEFLLKRLGVTFAASPLVTEEEVKIMIEQGTEAGVFEKDEETMLKRVLEFSEVRVRDVMTPRVNVVGIDSNLPSSSAILKLANTKLSYLPVYRGKLDDVVGVLSTKLVLEKLVHARPEDIIIEDCMIKEPLFVPESVSAQVMLERFKSTKKHLGIAIDEFGGVAGVVTLQDILESIVGNVPDYYRLHSDPMTKREDGSYLLDGVMTLDDIRVILDRDIFEKVDSEGLATISGLVMSELGRVPIVGDKIRTELFDLEVVDMDGNRIDKLLLELKNTAKHSKA